jgi:hypothetical protein
MPKKQHTEAEIISALKRKRPDIPSGEGSRCGMKIGSWFNLGM